MKRRQFLGSVLGGVAALTLTPADLARRTRRQGIEPGTLKRDQDGRIYRYARASRDLRVGECDEHGGQLIGFAVSPIRQGQYGWMATSGMLPVVSAT